MKREFLQNLKVGDEALPKEVIDAIMEENDREIKVQCSTDQNNWTTVATYDPGDYAQMIGTSTAFYADGVTYTGTSGYNYRAAVSYYAKSGNSVGYYDTYSDIMRL